jgi:hypothetical protein
MLGTEVSHVHLKHPQSIDGVALAALASVLRVNLAFVFLKKFEVVK